MNVNKLAKGWHTLQAKAYDAQKNEGVSATVMFSK
jgi:hypothetical protein